VGAGPITERRLKFGQVLTIDGGSERRERGYEGAVLRSARRRAKQSTFRRQRVPVEVPSEEPVSEADDEADGSEKIEVHVHVHRGEGSGRSRSKRHVPPVLTGALFDWQWYRDRLTSRPQHMGDGRWSRAIKCESCQSMIPSAVRRCPRCAAPRPRRLLPVALILVGIGSIAAMFALCVHILGTSVPEHVAPAPLGEWSEEDYVIVEVPTAPSPFSATAPPSYKAPPPGSAPENRQGPTAE
jgi:hypothetical protein